MTDSVRESALKALHGVLDAIVWSNSPAPTVGRNEVETDDIPAGGMVMLRDGDPGEPVEQYLSPLTFAYDHVAQIVVAVQKRTSAERDAAMDALLRDIDAAIRGDDTLGGAVELAEAGEPETLDEPVEGAESIKAVAVPVTLSYLSLTRLG